MNQMVVNNTTRGNKTYKNAKDAGEPVFKN